MMEDEKAFAWGMTLGLVLGAALAWSITWGTTADAYEEEAVKANVARFHPVTKEFEYVPHNIKPDELERMDK